MNDQLNLLYDQDADVLYFSIGHPKFTDYVELDDHLILRLDPQTQAIVGFTVIDFAKNFAQAQTPLSVPLTATLERAKSTRKMRVIAEAQAPYRIKRQSVSNRAKKKSHATQSHNK
jgi:uncharacterized protein YuzE